MADGHPVIAGGSSWSTDRKVKRWHAETLVFRDGEWTRGPDLPQRTANAAYATGPDGLYIAGGIDGETATASAFRFASVEAGAAWQPLASLPQPVHAAAGAILGNTFFIAGGYTEDGASNQLWALDLVDADPIWRRCAPFPGESRGYAALVACGESLYLFGGFLTPPHASSITIFDDVYRYDPASDSWESLEALKLRGYGWSAAAVDEQFIMLSGRVPEIGHIDDQIYLVDLDNQSAQTIGKLVIQACCMPWIQVNAITWWLPGGEPDTSRSRTARVSVVRWEDR